MLQGKLKKCKKLAGGVGGGVGVEMGGHRAED